MRRKDKSLDELKILHEADDAELGILVRTNDVVRLRSRLYTTLRANRGDFVNELTLTPDPDETDILVVVHKDKYHE